MNNVAITISTKSILTSILCFIGLMASSQHFEITNSKKTIQIRTQELIEIWYGKLDVEGYATEEFYLSRGNILKLEPDSITLFVEQTSIGNIRKEQKVNLIFEYSGNIGIQKVARKDIILIDIIGAPKRLNFVYKISTLGNILFVGGGVSFLNSLFFYNDNVTPLVSSAIITLIGSIIRLVFRNKIYRFNVFDKPWRFKN